MTRVKDLREYLAVLESLGDVEHIERPVSAMLEAAAITRRSTEMRRPAPLFDTRKLVTTDVVVRLVALCH